MEVVLVLLASLALGLALYALVARVRGRRPTSPAPRDELAGLVAGAGPIALAHHRDEVAVDLEEGALDPDELEPGELDLEPLVWDEGADDELG